MGINYVLIASILLYVVTVRAFGTRNFSVLSCSLVVTLGPFILNEIIRYIMVVGLSEPYSQLISVADGIKLALQFVAAVATFAQLKKEDDTIVSWFIWSSIGGASIYFLIPAIVQFIVGN